MENKYNDSKNYTRSYDLSKMRKSSQVNLDDFPNEKFKNKLLVLFPQKLYNDNLILSKYKVSDEKGTNLFGKEIYNSEVLSVKIDQISWLTQKRQKGKYVNKYAIHVVINNSENNLWLLGDVFLRPDLGYCFKVFAICTNLSKVVMYNKNKLGFFKDIITYPNNNFTTDFWVVDELSFERKAHTLHFWLDIANGDVGR